MVEAATSIVMLPVVAMRVMSAESVESNPVAAWSMSTAAVISMAPVSVLIGCSTRTSPVLEVSVMVAALVPVRGAWRVIVPVPEAVADSDDPSMASPLPVTVSVS